MPRSATTRKQYYFFISSLLATFQRDTLVACLAAPKPKLEVGTSRRVVFGHLLANPLLASHIFWPTSARAEEVGDSAPRKVTITLSSSADSLGLEVADDTDSGGVRIRKVHSTWNADLREGMIVDGVSSAKELSMRLRSGPYPKDLTFIEDKKELPKEASAFQSISISSTKQSDSCDAVGTRGSLIEIEYDAYYVTAEGRKNLYDASSFRGTGQPYQMVLGSGDMIPGVDLGIAGMCVGETRELKIPKFLGHGARSRKLFGIPDDHLGLVWTITLVRAEIPTL